MPSGLDAVLISAMTSVEEVRPAISVAVRPGDRSRWRAKAGRADRARRRRPGSSRVPLGEVVAALAGDRECPQIEIGIDHRADDVGRDGKGRVEPGAVERHCRRGRVGRVAHPQQRRRLADQSVGVGGNGLEHHLAGAAGGDCRAPGHPAQSECRLPSAASRQCGPGSRRSLAPPPAGREEPGSWASVRSRVLAVEA